MQSTAKQSKVSIAFCNKKKSLLGSGWDILIDFDWLLIRWCIIIIPYLFSLILISFDCSSLPLHNFVDVCLFPKHALAQWGSFLQLKELPKALAPSKLLIFQMFACVAFKTNELLRKVTFFPYRPQGIPIDSKVFLQIPRYSYRFQGIPTDSTVFL